jgi:hypothetical protein
MCVVCVCVLVFACECMCVSIYVCVCVCVCDYSLGSHLCLQVMQGQVYGQRAEAKAS